MPYFNVVEKTKHKMVLAFTTPHAYMQFQQTLYPYNQRWGITKEIGTHMDTWVWDGTIMAEYSRRKK